MKLFSTNQVQVFSVFKGSTRSYVFLPKKGRCLWLQRHSIMELKLKHRWWRSPLEDLAAA